MTSGPTRINFGGYLDPKVMQAAMRPEKAGVRWTSS